MTIAFPSAFPAPDSTTEWPTTEWPTTEWPEDWSAIADECRWTLDRAASKLADIVVSQPMSLPAAFQFRWRSGLYRIAIQDSEETALLHLSGIVGTIPFTLEDRSSRRRVLDTLRHMRDIWPCAGLSLAGGQVRLARQLQAEQTHLSFREMVAQASAALLPVQPIIELIESDLWPAA